MKRTVRRSTTLVGAALMVVSLTAFTPARGTGDSNSPQRFARIPGAVNNAHFTPASLQSDRKVTVIVELSGGSVGQRMAAALRHGASASGDRGTRIRAQLGRQHGDVRSSIAAKGGSVLYDYRYAYNGLAARIPLEALRTVSAMPSVKKVHPVRTFTLDNTAGVRFIGGDKVWDETGFTGKGVDIGVIDTGIDYTHADFGGSGDPADFENNDGTVIEPGTFPTAKVVGGFDFVGDDYDASSDDPAKQTPRPDPDPLDCFGHGTHVSGTAAGLGVLADGSTYGGPYNAGIFDDNDFAIGPGVAPEARLHAYRVFGCSGSAAEDVIVAAMDRAMKDGVDVVNMSLGSPFGRTDEPTAEAANTLSKAGVAVVASAGNSGSGAYITGAPSIANRAISAAAIDASSPTYPGATLALSTGESLVAQNSNGAELADGTQLPVKVLRNADGSVSLGCDPDDYTGVEGALVVTQRGTCARVARAVYGQQAGAAAVAMINSDPGFPPFEGQITENPDTGEKVTVTIPFLGVRGVLGPDPTPDGDTLVAADGGTATLTNTQVDNPGYKRLASFTSAGPRNGDSAAKPDVTAPGVSVVSAGIGTGTGGATLSGTSMAAPFTTGTVALVTQAHPGWSPEQVKAALMNTADATAGKILDYDPLRAGAGVIQADRAVDTVALATAGAGQGTLSFGYEPLDGAYSETRSLTLTNAGQEPITYDLAAGFAGDSHGVRADISPASVTVPAGGQKTVDVTLSLSAGAAAELPGSSTFALGPGAVLNARGVVTATPRRSGPGVYPLRVPFLVVPRGLSDVTAGHKEPYDLGRRGTVTTSVPVTNGGVHAGAADVYAWGIADRGEGYESMDVRAAGVQTLPGEALGGSKDDRSLVFAINTYGRWSNAAVSEFDVLIDTNRDGEPDFVVAGVDLGAVLAGAFNGTMASFVLTADGEVVAARFAEAPMNGSTLLLPALASEIGLSGARHASDFTYAVNAFSIVPEGLVDTTQSARFDAFRPALSTGQFVELAPGEKADVGLSFRISRLVRAPAFGWLVVTVDDANGGAQAERVSILPTGRHHHRFTPPTPHTRPGARGVVPRPIPG